MKFIKVVFNINLDTSFIYKKSGLIEHEKLLFKRVLVPFKNKLSIGFVIEEFNYEDKFQFKVENIVDIIDDNPLISSKEFEFYKWMSEYYIVPVGQIIFNALPAFSVDRFKIIVNPQINYAQLNNGEKKLLELLETENNLKKIQKNFKFFFLTLNSLKNKNIINITRKKQRGKKVKFIEIVDNNNLKLKDFFKSNKILPFEYVKVNLKNFKKYIKEGKLNLIEKNREFLPETLDASFKYFRPEQLNAQQEKIFKAIREDIVKGKFSCHLIFGVTGSGKTEIYLNAIEETLKKGKQVLFLVPEISLTANIGHIILTSFPNYEVIVYHSKISKNTRYEIWKRCAKNEVNIVVGARSALFTPLNNLGLIIVDEEHEQSYKQEDKPRYNARDCAVMKAKLFNATTILGSATPSVQSYYNAKTGKYKFHILKKRVNNQPLPDFKIIDLKNSFGDKIISLELKKEILTTINDNGQVILLLNKKGYASYVICNDCGYVFKCLNCDLTLTYYKSKERLVCSYCDNVYPLPAICPNCEGTHIKYMGKGTEKIVERVVEELKDVRVGRFDAQSTTKQGENVKILKEFNNGNLDILVGTQMLAKGYDFKNVALVGIVTVDNLLNFPDYNSTEKTFQLIIQCAGRAGRGGKKGKVLLQTYSPDNYIFKFSKEYRFEDFYEYELQQRKSAMYPPYYAIAHIIFESININRVKKISNESAKILNEISNNKIVVLGPVESQIKKIRNKFRYSILVKSRYRKTLREACTILLKSLTKVRGVDIKLDIDPISLN